MTLIPLISAIISAPEATTAPAGAAVPLSRNSYGSDGGRHPVAALFAVGLPAALVVAVALSPMIVEKSPTTDPIIGTLIELPKPPPPAPRGCNDRQWAGKITPTQLARRAVLYILARTRRPLFSSRTEDQHDCP